MSIERAAPQPNRQLLVTGFGPWGPYPSNASQALLEQLQWTAPSGWELARRIIPVSWTAARDEARRIALSKAAAVVAFGQYDGDCIRIERRGIDRQSRSKPDADSHVFADPATESGRAIASTLPCQALLDQMRSAEIPCRLSDSAGDFLCNYFFYRLLAEFEARGSSAPIGFVHIPAGRALDIDVLHRAAAICLRAAAAAAPRALSFPPQF